jgi:hypothetical protein
MDQSSRLDAGIPRQGRNCGHPATGSLIAANIDPRRRSAWGCFLDTGSGFRCQTAARSQYSYRAASLARWRWRECAPESDRTSRVCSWGNPTQSWWQQSQASSSASRYHGHSSKDIPIARTRRSFAPTHQGASRFARGPTCSSSRAGSGGTQSDLVTAIPRGRLWLLRPAGGSEPARHGLDTKT